MFLLCVCGGGAHTVPNWASRVDLVVLFSQRGRPVSHVIASVESGSPLGAPGDEYGPYSVVDG